VREPLPSWMRNDYKAVCERLERRARGSVPQHLTWDRALGLALLLEELCGRLDREDELVPRLVADVRDLLRTGDLPTPPRVEIDHPTIDADTDADRLAEWLFDRAHAIADLIDAPPNATRTELLEVLVREVATVAALIEPWAEALPMQREALRVLREVTPRQQ